MKSRTEKSSGNVFIDLGFDKNEAAVLQMRANLMSDLRLYIEKRKPDSGSGCQAIRHCAIPRVRPRTRQMGQVQLGNAYHARSAHWAESASRGNSVMAADSVKVSQVEQRLRRTM
jgi:hypothetical protein